MKLEKNLTLNQVISSSSQKRKKRLKKAYVNYEMLLFTKKQNKTKKQAQNGVNYVKAPHR